MASASTMRPHRAALAIALAILTFAARPTVADEVPSPQAVQELLDKCVYEVPQALKKKTGVE